MIRLSAGVFFRDIWHGILGIIAEIALIILFIVAGFAVCALWWSMCR